jgi:hypothetical protein
VLLFCDEAGELPGFLSMWQTHDDSCNPEFIMDKVPKFLQYDWKKHYREYQDTTPDLEAVGRDRWFCEIIDPNFTLKERIQRYFCRVIWLTRNCSYGFSFWFLGKAVDTKNIVTYKEVTELDGTKLEILYDKSESILTRAWKLKSNRWIIKDVIRWEVFCGWKLSDEPGMHQAMIANRICFRFGHY